MEHMPDYGMIGQRIRNRRQYLNMTQEKLAEAAGVGVQHMSKIENGHTKLSLPCIIAVANALSTTVDNLLMDNIDASKADVVKEAESVFEDCSPSELFVLRETVTVLKQSLRKMGFPSGE